MLTKLNKRMRRMAAVGLLGGAALFQLPAAGGCDYITDMFWRGYDFGSSLVAAEQVDCAGCPQQPATVDWSCLKKTNA